MTSSTLPYQQLVESFVEGELSAVQFEAEYLRLFKHDTSRSKEVYPILSNLFWAVEDFCVYPELRDESDLDENQLLQAAKVALESLKKLEADHDAATTLTAPSVAKYLIEISEERLEQLFTTIIAMQFGKQLEQPFTNIGKKRPELKQSNKPDFIKAANKAANDEQVTHLPMKYRTQYNNKGDVRYVG
jgi:hypothetical protein